MNPSSAFWKGKSVFLTGHTGFKGGWLAMWLESLGSRVHGYALDPPTAPNLFEATSLGTLLASDTRADVTDLAALPAALMRSDAEVVFHLAAQPLVHTGYADPIGTFTTNVIGTASLLEAVRSCETVRSVVVITSDKVYMPFEAGRRHSESDSLGGGDPYSASKAASELVASAYRSVFRSGAGVHHPPIATARAGNVIGGGDWAVNRLVPDCIRASLTGSPLHLRSSTAVRPWQHVLEPLGGYLALAERLSDDASAGWESAWNFGPSDADHVTVAELVERFAEAWGEDMSVDSPSEPSHRHETLDIRLDTTRARSELGWSPRWPLSTGLAETAAWYRSWRAGDDMQAVSRDQIRSFQAADLP